MIFNTGLIKTKAIQGKSFFSAERLITFTLIAFIIFVWFFGQSSALSITITAPNGGETWLQGTTNAITYSITPNTSQKDFNTSILESIYYSKISGARQTLIVSKKPLIETINPDQNSQGYVLVSGDAIAYDNTGGHFVDGAGSQQLTNAAGGITYVAAKKFFPDTNFFDLNKNGGKIVFYVMTDCVWCLTSTSAADIRLSLTDGTLKLLYQVSKTGDGQSIDNNGTWYRKEIDLNAMTVYNAANLSTDLMGQINIESDSSAAGNIGVNTWFDGIRIYQNKDCPVFDGNQTKTINCSYSWTLPASGDLNNLYVDINAQDLNVARGNPTVQDSSDELFNFQGLRFRIYDEGTIANKIQPDIFTIDSNSWLLYCSSGTCVIPNSASITKNWHLISIGKTGYGTRDYNLLIDVNTTMDINAVLMPTSTGKTITFQFYAPNKTTLLSNYLVTPKYKNLYWAGVQTTDNTGKASFYLDANGAEFYTFDLNNLIDGQTDYNYGTTRVTVLNPKDEKTFSSISPYTLTISNLAIGRDYNAITTSIDFNIFSNTFDYYKFKVDDANQGKWLTRTWLIQTKGNDSTYIFEPFLPSSGEGIYSTILVYDTTTKGFLPNVTVKIKRDINGSNQEIFSNFTDLAGSVNPSFLYLYDYNAEFWSGTKFVFGGILQASSTIYYVSIDLNYSIFDYNAPILTDVNFSGASVIECGSTGKCHFDQNIAGANITKITYLITNASKTLMTTTNYTSSDANWNWLGLGKSHFEQNFNISSIDTNADVTIKIIITKSDGTTTTRWKAYGILEYGQTNLKASLQAVKDLIGDFGAQMLALFITICAVGAAVTIKPDAPSAATILGMVLLGLFTYVGWFSTNLFVLLCFVAFIVYLYLRRETE